MAASGRCQRKKRFFTWYLKFADEGAPGQQKVRANIVECIYRDFFFIVNKEALYDRQDPNMVGAAAPFRVSDALPESLRGGGRFPEGYVFPIEMPNRVVSFATPLAIFQLSSAS